MSGDRGFTLVELIVALTIGTLVVLMVHRIVGQIVDQANAVIESRERLDHEMNGRRMVSALIENTDMTAEEGEFIGYPHRVSFVSWFLDERGRWRRDRITIAAGFDSTLLVMGLADEPYAVLPGVRWLSVEYLREGTWLPEWISKAHPPSAVRIRIGRSLSIDTLLSVVGWRG